MSFMAGRPLRGRGKGEEDLRDFLPSLAVGLRLKPSPAEATFRQQIFKTSSLRIRRTSVFRSASQMAEGLRKTLVFFRSYWFYGFASEALALPVRGANPLHLAASLFCFVVAATEILQLSL
jgi:hypothetical protein